MTSRRIWLLLAAVMLLHPGCSRRGWRTLDALSRDEKRMVYPGEEPDEGIFVAIRGDRVLRSDPDEDPADGKADLAAPSIRGAEPTIRIRPADGSHVDDAPPPTPRPPTFIPPTTAPPRPIPLTQPGF